jgi:murein L,D-transpeptidase YcbB/YkuD
MARFLARICLALLLTLPQLPLHAADALPALLAELARGGELRADASTVRNSALLQAFYRAQAQQPAWSDPLARASLVDAVRAAEGDGLDPADYHLATLLAAAPGDDGALMDLVRSDALLRLAADLYHGRVDPADFLDEIELTRAAPGPDVVALLREALAAHDLPAALQRLSPQSELYRGLRRALAEYRAIAARGGWPVIPEGPTMHPGDRSSRVVALRQRLLASANGTADTTRDPEFFDPALETAVRHFQSRHQLAADGVVGKKTLAAANVSAAARIGQIRANLERARWLLHDLPPTYVLVDIAGFEVRYFRDGRELLRSRAAVGQPYRKTPIFRSRISHLEFNPSWTVPPTILTKDVLPEIRKDPGYLARRTMRVLTFQGQEVDPAGIDWRRYSGRNLPYVIRQDPGPKNALGQVKFMFPNAHMVYLHDTPEREIFRQPERAFSSGCIRIEQARRLAVLLLGAEGRSEAEVDALFAEAKTRRVPLAQPVPILLYYWTVALGDDGDVLFKRDLYGRDDALLAALDHTQGD